MLECIVRMGSFECQSTCGIGLRLDSRGTSPGRAHEALTSPSQVSQLLVVGWVCNTPKTVKFFFASFHRVHLVKHWEKVIKIG